MQFSQSRVFKSTTEEKAEEIYTIFNTELKLVNNELNQQTKCFPDDLPLLAGQAHWVMALRHRIERQMEVSPSIYYTVFRIDRTLYLDFHTISSSLVLQVLQKAHFLPESYSHKQVIIGYKQTVHVLDERLRKYFSEWNHKLDGQYLKALEQPLLVRNRDSPAKLDVNFDRWVTHIHNKKLK